MRTVVLILIAALAGCSKGPTVLELYDLPAVEVNDRVPKQVHVCWGLQAAHMQGLAEAGLEQDIAATCERSAGADGITSDCRSYAIVAARYGRAAAKGMELSQLSAQSDEAFAACVG